MQHPRWLKKVLTKSPCRLCQNVVRFFLVLTCHVIVNSLYLFSGKWEMNYSWQVKVYLFENEDFIYQFTRFVLSLTGAYWTMLELLKIQLLMYFFYSWNNLEITKMYSLYMQQQFVMWLCLLLAFWKYTKLNFLSFRLEEGSAAMDMHWKNEEQQNAAGKSWLLSVVSPSICFRELCYYLRNFLWK